MYIEIAKQYNLFSRFIRLSFTQVAINSLEGARTHIHTKVMARNQACVSRRSASTYGVTH